ncbi:STAS domain-containing protein [Geodermatophilus sp. SYSU D01045]
MTIEHEGTCRVLRLRGELDTAVAEQFKGRTSRDALSVDVIDAADVSFISSTALAVLARCSEVSLAAGRRPVLRASSPALERILQLSGLQDDFLRPPATPSCAETPG